ncbi:syntaxin-like isoform X2 [Bolinopsis microptera]|uniref:syntaxin-like isoform X2 n=1 Tax=Bolinopsis microptera TaxID=2820187 RepID=UPI003079FC86
MRDRINFFRLQTDDHEAYDGRVTILDVHSGGDHADEMKKFLKDAQQVRDKVVGIESIVNQIRGYHGKITGSAARNEDVHQSLNRAMDEIREMFDTVKQALKTLDEKFKAVKADDSDQNHRTSDVRIMSSQYTTLQRWFFETWTEYNECQSDYREKCKEKLTRQIQITEKKVTPAEIDDMIESGKFTVFSYNAQFQPKDMEELETRSKDITKLAESLKQLHEMFRDLALMVEQQGEMLNNIEKNVDQSHEHVKQAEVELKEAKEITDKTRRRKVICAAVILAILLIIAVVIAITIKLQS